MSDLSRRLSSLSVAQREALVRRIRERGLSLADLPIPPRSEKRHVFPLSFAQERLWFLHQLEEESAPFQLVKVERWPGRLDHAVLRHALAEVVRRHETLRTTFGLVDGEAVQIVHDEPRYDFLHVDVSGLEPRDREAAARRVGTVLAHRRYNDAEDPPLRGAVVELGEDDQVLILVLPHILSDGWSLEVLRRELFQLYEAGWKRRAASLPPLEIQYGDWALWQRAWLAEEIFAHQGAYWRDQLAGLPEVLELPIDRPRPPRQTYRGSVCRFALPPELTAAAKTLARGADATLFGVLTAVFGVLLSRHSGQRDVAIGTSIAGRDRLETEGLIGFFVNTLVLRADLRDRPSFVDFVERMGRVVLAAHENQDLPFERLIEQLAPRRHLAYSPLFQVMFAMQVKERRDPRTQARSGRQAKGFASEVTVSTFDLNLEMLEQDDAVHGSLYYNVDLFDAATATRLARQLVSLLAAAVEHGDAPPCQALPLLLPGERHALEHEHNDTRFDGWRELDLVSFLAAQSRQAPDRTALVFAAEDAPQVLSYGEFTRRTARLAARLQRLGVGPEVLVGVCGERSLELVIALWGVARAGGAYVPLDPSYPAERLAMLLGDILASSPKSVVLADGAGLARLPESRPAVLSFAEIAALDANFEAGPELAVDGAVSPDALLYVIHTSGSTGQPKGVMNARRAVVNRLMWMQRALSLEAGDRVLQKTPFSFDVSVWEFFWPFLAGATLVVAPPEIHRDAAALLRILDEEGVTTVHFVPSMLELFLAELELTAPPRVLARLVTSGEALPPQLADRVRARLGATLFNLYGPTEAAVDVTCWRADTSLPVMPIGRPLSNVRLHVVDRELRATAWGVPGELLIGGVQVARGYLGRGALTAERFVPDPWPSVPGERLYRTGDRVRRLPGGELAFLGRLDFQVKLRGFRIELGEIEEACRRQDGVREAVVLLVGEAEDARLVAFVVPVLIPPTPLSSGSPSPAMERGSGGEDKIQNDLDASILRTALRRALPEHMVPSRFVVLAELPTSANGKVDRKALMTKALDGAAEGERGSFTAPRGELEATLARLWGEVLGLEQVGIEDNFFDLGGHSLLVAKVRNRLRQEQDIEISVVDLFRHPTIASLAAAISERARREDAEKAPKKTRGTVEPVDREPCHDIAVIGMSGRFPGASDVTTFWRHLEDGVESVTFFSDEELLSAGVAAEVLENPSFVKALPWLENVDLFDAQHFGYTPREAEITDPQQRLFLEVAWEALENAGHDPVAYDGAIGLWAGMGMSRYWIHLFSNPKLLASLGELQVVVGNDKDFLTTRVGYKLDLRGPIVSVQTACSTALVAAHLACQSLALGECDMALAGGASILAYDKGGYFYQPGGIASPDGHCRAFDAEAGGTVFGSGVGLVVLKRLADAIADGDHVHAVIKGSAINNDGAAKVGFTAPGVPGQVDVIRAAQRRAGVTAASVGYVEAHGTGTRLGDPIEVAALQEVWSDAEAGSCALGSVKTNVGHLDAAAGVAGLIKAVLALEHRRIPPTLHFETPNPELGLDGSPFFVNTEPVTWPTAEGPRRAGVSSFGIGGTNAHLVLEEAPPPAATEPSRPAEVLTLSARSEAALEHAASRLAAHLRAHPELEIGDIAFTLKAGRRAFDHRLAVVCRSMDDAAAKLEDATRSTARGVKPKDRPPIFFLFPGQGAQVPGMARALHDLGGEPRRQIDAMCELLEPHLGLDLRPLLLASEEDADELRQTALAQPALFVVSTVLARQWLAWGVEPAAMLGHSLGELVAAHLAGVWSLEDALRLVAARGRLMQSLPGGAMAGIALGEDEIAPYLGDGVELAAVNAPRRVVVSGSETALAALEERLRAKDVAIKRLHTSHAFHSAAIEPMLDAFRRELESVAWQRPARPFLSNLTGEEIRPEQAVDPGYWLEHARRAVRFAPAVELLAERPGVFLELGPRQLTSLVAAHPAARRHVATAALPEAAKAAETDGLEILLGAVARLWTVGVELDGTAFYGPAKRRRTPLPTYPFERQRYWVEARQGGPSHGLGPRAELADAFHQVRFKLADLPAEPTRELGDGPCLAFLPAGAEGLTAALGERLGDVIAVRPGDAFAAEDDGFTVEESGEDGYARLFAALRERGPLPSTVLHLWTLGPSPASDDERRACLERGLFSLHRLIQGWAEHGAGEPLRLLVATGHGLAVDGEIPCPERAALIGATRVLAQEYWSLDVTAVDVDETSKEELTELLLAELRAGASERVAAWRRGERFVETVDRLRLERRARRRPQLRHGGVYLITGGLGGIGLTLARALAAELRPKLILLSRSPLPERDAWPSWLAEHGEDDAVSRKIRQVIELEADGAEVWPVAADVADQERMAAVVAEAEARFGAIHGVIHAAGLPTAGLTDQKARAELGRVLEPKVAGTRVLAAVLDWRRLDFVLLCSSTAALLGGPGNFEYCAANAFLDAVAEGWRGAETLVTAVAWGAWREVGMAAASNLGFTDEDERRAYLRRMGLRPEEGAEAFHRILDHNLRRVAVFPRNLAAALAESQAARRAPSEDEKPQSAYQRPELETAYTAPRDELERDLVGIWQGVLGIGRIGVDDDFFDLGADSLLATQVLNRVRRELGGQVSLKDLFAAPTIDGLAALLRQRGDGGEATARPRRDPSRRVFPLSFAQERLWFLHTLDPGNLAYNLSSFHELPGAFDLAALERALGEIVRRHDALRSRFVLADGSPAQIVDEAAPVTVPRVDLSALAAQRRIAEARRLQVLQRGRPFDLEKGPLFRVLLAELGPEDRSLFLAVHHLAVDAWSLAILHRELAVLYDSFRGERPSPLPELAVGYADYAAWEREHFDEARLRPHLDYWRAQLAGAPSRLELPADRPRPAQQTFRGAHLPVVIHADLAAALKNESRACGATLFMGLLAIFEMVLARFSGQSDFCVGSPVAGRNLPETEPLMGFFVNTLVLRSALGGGPSLRQALARTRDVVLAAHEHQDLPFARLVAALSPERSTSHSPFFQVMFAMENTPELTAAEDWSRFEMGKEAAPFDLDLELLERPSGRITGWLNFNTDLFDRTTMRRLLDGCATLLAAASTEPDRGLWDLPLLSPTERHAVLVAWNDSATVEATALVPELVARTAVRRADAVAVVKGEGHLSYGELARRAGALAAELEGLGVGPEKPVAICLERGPELVIAALGALWTSGAYLPLEVSHPPERLAFAIDDAGAEVVLTATRHEEALAATRARRLLIDRPATAAPEQTPGRVAPGHLAYVIYTSGSTGRAKGVEIEHRGLANLVGWHLETFKTSAADRVTQVASPAFDAAVWEIWPALVAGAALLVPDEETRQTPSALIAWLVAERITATFLPTPLAELVLAEPWPRDAALRWLLTGGDRLGRRGDPSLPWRLVNCYGPTESSVVASAQAVAPHGPLPPSIGRGIANTRLYVCGRRLQLVPRGVAGELCLAGRGLARGYCRRPGTTAASFVPDPFAERPGERLYRTGDRVRLLADGDVEFLGRLDYQVKVRGFRIELGEIEAALRELDGVLEAAVLTREESSGETRLVAYVVLESGIAAATLRDALRRRLPDYMVPSRLVALDALPLTTNGKVDRRALAALPVAEDVAVPETAPQSTVVEVLCGLWASLLGVESVAPGDDFFALGGYSLQATRLVSEVRRLFAVELRLLDFFAEPTVAALARLVETRARGELAAPIEPMPGAEPAPLSLAQERLWFLYQLEPQSAAFNIFVAHRFDGALDPLAFAHSVGALLERHETLRTTFEVIAGEAVQIVQPVGEVPLTVVDLAGLDAERDVERLAEREAYRPFDLRRGPVFRVHLLRLAAERHVVFCAMHHIVADGWSVQILIRDLATLYAARVAGEPTPLPPMAIQYRDYATWQRRAASAERIAAQLAYWRGQLAGELPVLRLPEQRPRPDLPRFLGDSVTRLFDTELSDRVRRLSRQEGATLFMTLLAAFKATLHLMTGEAELVVGTNVANRERPEVEDVIGFFVNNLVLRTDVGGDPSFRELLDRVRRMALQAYAHQDVPYETVQNAVAPSRAGERGGLFQVFFLLDDFTGAVTGPSTLQLRPVELRRRTANFDLTLLCAMTPEGLHATAVYDTDLFAASVVEDLLGHLETVLAQVAADPERPLSRLSLTSRDEADDLVGAFNVDL